MLVTALAALMLQAASAPPTYTAPGFRDFDPNQTFQSVGPFGSFGKGTQLQERDEVGLLTFTLRKDAPHNTLVWANFDNGGDFVLGQADFFGALAQKKQFQFIDWTTARLDFPTSDGARSTANRAYFSRCFPAVLYQTEAKEWHWGEGNMHADFAMYRDSEGVLQVASPGRPLGELGSPWVLIWPKPAAGTVFAPILIRFERKPTYAAIEHGLQARFSGPAGSIAVMPLFGVRRPSYDAKTDGWATQADFWSSALAAFPVKLHETYTVIDARRIVRITDSFSYLTMRDDWHTKPLRLAPVSPVTEIAREHGYPVQHPSSPILKSEVATLLGPWDYALGDRFSYDLPIPSARDDALAPVRVTGDASRQQAAGALDGLVDKQTIKPDDTSDGGLNLQLKEFSQSYPLLSRQTQAKLAPLLEAAYEASYAPDNLQTVTDPVTGRRYVMCNKIWCAGEPYDREWYTGRQLDATYEYNAWVDPGAAQRHWQAIQGLYAYFRIYNDWAWSGTLSSVFAYALTGDGMNFAMEGMLAAARLARLHGDDELWRDASYRAAKEALCTYASWFLSDWEKSIDYVTWTDTSYDYQAKRGRYQIKRMAPADVQTGFSLDIYSDTTGIKVFRNGSFWHASAAEYWNNMSLDRLYLDHLYGKLFQWEYHTLPELHPQWTNPDAVEQFSNQHYGSNMVNVHVDARTVLFGDAPDRLGGLMTHLQPDIAPLYRVRSAEDLVESGIPELWLPTDAGTVSDAVWDAEHRELSAKLRGAVGGAVTLDWRWPGAGGVSPTADAGPQPARVEVDGKPVGFHKIAGGFWRALTEVRQGQEIDLRVTYALRL